MQTISSKLHRGFSDAFRQHPHLVGVGSRRVNGEGSRRVNGEGSRRSRGEGSRRGARLGGGRATGTNARRGGVASRSSRRRGLSRRVGVCCWRRRVGRVGVASRPGKRGCFFRSIGGSGSLGTELLSSLCNSGLPCPFLCGKSMEIHHSHPFSTCSCGVSFSQSQEGSGLPTGWVGHVACAALALRMSACTVARLRLKRHVSPA